MRSAEADLKRAEAVRAAGPSTDADVLSLRVHLAGMTEQRIDRGAAAEAQAEESLRITQNRYAAGLNNVTELLRTEAAVLDSRTRYLAATHDQRIAATMLELAAGRLTADSEVSNW